MKEERMASSDSSTKHTELDQSSTRSGMEGMLEQIPTAAGSELTEEASSVSFVVNPLIESNTDKSCSNIETLCRTNASLLHTLDVSLDSSDLSQPSTSKPQDISSNSKTSDLKRPSSNLSKEINMEPELFKRNKIDIYAEDNFPKWYKVQGNLVTRPILAKKLPEVYDFLPIFGAPSSKKNLKEFQSNNIREFIGGLNDDEFSKLAQYCR